MVQPSSANVGAVRISVPHTKIVQWNALVLQITAEEDGLRHHWMHHQLPTSAKAKEDGLCCHRMESRHLQRRRYQMHQQLPTSAEEDGLRQHRMHHQLPMSAKEDGLCCHRMESRHLQRRRHQMHHQLPTSPDTMAGVCTVVCSEWGLNTRSPDRHAWKRYSILLQSTYWKDVKRTYHDGLHGVRTTYCNQSYFRRVYYNYYNIVYT